MIRGAVIEGVNVIQQMELGKNRLCLVVANRKVVLEVWLKTRRRKSPWDRYPVASMTDPGGGLALNPAVSTKVAEFREQVLAALPSFQAMAVVETVSAR